MPWREWPWEKIAALVLTPGVPLTHPKPHERRASAPSAIGVEVIGDMEMFAREIRPDRGSRPSPVIAITGTNGKSTTTALIGHILAAAASMPRSAAISASRCCELSPPAAKTVYVLEMSSYQIDLSPGFVPDVALLSNITPDHIDRHGVMENYAAVKTKLLKQTAKDGLNIVRRR